MASPSPEKDNFLRISALLVDGGAKLLRSIIDSIHTPATLSAALAVPKTKKELKKARLSKVESSILYPPAGVEVKSEDLDITLLSKVLRHVCNLPTPPAGWDKLPSAAHQSPSDDLVRIRIYRNEAVAHATEMKLDDVEFQRLWKEISGAMIRLAKCISTAEETKWKALTEQYLSGPLTCEEEDYTKDLESWCERDRLLEEEMRAGFEDIGEGIAGLSQQMSRVEKLVSCSQEERETRAGMPRTSDQVVINDIQFNNNDAHRIAKGSGGTKVFEGRMLSTGDKVAVKVMVEGVFDESEAKRLMSFDHPNIIKCHAVERKDPFIYVALELCEKTLAACVRDNDFHRKQSRLDKLSCLKEVTRAVMYLHERNLCHRDIKPDNILLSKSAPLRFVLADFNIAKNVNSASTQVGNPAGSRGYIAPELYRLNERITTKADLFALGCVFYHVLTDGGHPFGSVKDLKKCQANIFEGEQPTVQEEAFCEHAWIAPFIRQMFQPDPAQRPSAEVVLEFLEGTLDPAGQMPAATSTGEVGPIDGKKRESETRATMSSPPIPPLAIAVQRKEKSSEDDTDTSSSPPIMAPRVAESLETTPISCGSREEPEASYAAQWSPSDKSFEDITEKIVQVTEEDKGRVIGRRGSNIKEIRAESGALILDHVQGFLVKGRADQIAYAEKQILQTLERRHKVEGKELVQVDSQYRGYVIGYLGTRIKAIQRTTGTVIKNHEQGFSIIGSSEQINAAKDAILRLVEEARSKGEEEIVKVDKDHKAYVNGTGGTRVRQIEVTSGAGITPHDEGFLVRGPPEQRKIAKKLILAKVDERNKKLRRMTSCAFVDDLNLPDDCVLRLTPAGNDHQPEIRYRLQAETEHKQPVTGYSQGGCATAGNSPSYLPDLRERMMQCLQDVKQESNPGSDMWGHFGIVNHEVPEEDISKGWTLKEARDNLVAKPHESEEHTCQPRWQSSYAGADFKERDHFDGRLQKHSYASRYDLTFRTPFGRKARCKVWIKSKGHEDSPHEIPYSDFKNVLQEFTFKDKKTNDRCKGWLCFRSDKRLTVDIAFPGCDLDCRLMFSRRELCVEDVNAWKEKLKNLVEYLSLMTLNEDDESDVLPLPNAPPPEKFVVEYRRRSERALYTYNEEFTAIFSEECSYPTKFQPHSERKDLHLHCKSWDEMLRSGQWKPEDVLDKLPEFMEFVRCMQQIIAPHQPEHST